MVIKTFKILSRAIFGLVALMIILLVCGYIWLSNGPKSIPFAANLITKQANKIIPDAKFTIEKLEAKTNNYRIDINISNFNIALSNHDPIILKKTNIKLNPIGLLPFSKQPFANLEISLDNINFAPSKETNQELTKDIPVGMINEFLIRNQKKLKKFHFILLNSSYTIIKNNNPITIKAEKASFTPINNFGNILLKADIEATINGEPVKIQSIFDTSSKKDLTITGLIKGLTYKSLASLGIGTKILDNASISFDLKFDALTNKFNTFKTLKFNINSSNGFINPNQNFTSPIKVDSISVLGECFSGCTTINLNQLKILAQGNQIFISGKYENSILNINATTSSTNLEQILKLWPKSLAPQTYNWLQEYLKKADVKGITANLNFNLEDLSSGKPLGNDSLYVNLPIQNAVIQFPKNSSEISNINGVIDIALNKVNIKLDSGKVLSSQLQEFTLDLQNLGTVESTLNIKGKVNGPIQEAIDLGFIYSKKENSELKDLQGEALSEIDITIPLSDSQDNAHSLGLNIISNITDFKADLFKKYPITNGKVTVKLNNNLLVINGEATYKEDIPFKFEHKETLEATAAENYLNDTKIDISIGQDYLKKNGYNLDGVISSNKIPISLIINKNLNQEMQTKVNVNLKDVGLNIDKLNITKNTGEPGSLTLKLESLETGEYKIKEYNLTLPTVSSVGAIELNPDFKIKVIDSNKTVLNGSTFGFLYKNTDKSEYVLLKGNELNLGNYNFSKLFNTSKAKREKPFILESKIKRIKLKNGVLLNSDTISIKCSQYSCGQVNLNGELDSNHKVNALLNYPNLNIDTTNAGKLVAALGISKNIADGTLKLTGTFSNKDTLSGNLTIDNFHLKHTPILARLISLSSLTTASGIINIMQGKGVVFDKLNCPYSFQDGVITINKCVQKGPVLTILTDGTIDLNKKYIDITGTLVPANIINSIVDNIPLIGPTISGGKNSGIIGTKFTLKGSLEGEGPTPSVNPLSILTPGFLRNIF